MGLSGLPCYLSAGGINKEIAILEKVVNQLVEQSVQLESVNRELEAFSYSVSHDLRAPLRSVEGFSSALKEDCADRLDATCHDYLARISAAIKRMEHLIEGLLRLSRLSRAELHREPVELGVMVREIAEELRKAHPGRSVTVHVADDAGVTVDAALMRVVVTNLLENAWKFTAGVEHPVIEFGVGESGGERHYFVRDNGAGFDPAHADKLFVPFQRLHRVEEFPGTGIGLATVQRILHRHGGRIWAEGEEGKGATFYFTLRE
jgi:light-regulated signal transduction histidine kinase (bacteriophytochrome)